MKHFLLAIILIFLFVGASVQTIRAQDTQYGEPLTSAERQQLRASLLDPNNSCPEQFRRFYLDLLEQNPEIYARGSIIVAYDQDNAIMFTCADASNIQKIVIRVFMIIYTIIGLVLAFAVVRSAILMTTAFGNSEQFENGYKSLFTSIAYTVILIFSYMIFVFVAVGVLGVGTSTRNEYNLFCQNRIVLNLTFDDSEPC
jgi:hypothetical protein